MERYFDQILKQQQKVNDDLKEFSDYLESLLSNEKHEHNKHIKPGVSHHQPNQHNSLSGVFGLKGSPQLPVKPSFLFSNTPDIKRFVEFRNYYIDNILNREHIFKASFSDQTETDTNDNHSFINILELLFDNNEKHLDQLCNLKTLYGFKQLISKYERKYQLLYDDFFIDSRGNFNGLFDKLYQPNKPLLDEDVNVHRIIVSSELFSPYEFVSDGGTTETAFKAFQIILHGNSKILKKRLSALPPYSELYSLVEEQSGRFHYSNLRKEIFPEPFGDLPGYKTSNLDIEISVEQLEWLSTKYLPNIFRHLVEWENSLLKRSETIYKFLSYFTKQPSESRRGKKQDWSAILCSQYPIIVKRNGQYMLAFGIRWKPFTDIKGTIRSFTQKGLYGLEFNTEHFNNFPYFFKDGRESIATKRPSTTSGLLGNFKEKLKSEIIKRSGNDSYCYPKYPPLRHWIFDHFFNQSTLSKTDFSSVMEGRRSLFEIIIKYRPDLILENQLYETLKKRITESMRFSKRDFSKNAITVAHLKSTKIPEFSKHITLFLPFYFYDNDFQIFRIDHSFSTNISKYTRYLVDALCDLTGCLINASEFNLLDLLEIRECIQEKLEKFKVSPSFLFHGTERVITQPKRYNIIDIIPYVLESVRFNLKYLRLDNLYFKLYTRGLYIPENPLLHRDYIQQKIKIFLTKLKNQEKDLTKKIHSNYEDLTLMKDNLSLLSRFLNLKWKRPLSYVQVMTPSTRLVIQKLASTYLIPLRHVLQFGIKNQSINTIPIFLPIEADNSRFAFKLLDITPSYNQDYSLLENLKNFIGKYQHDVDILDKHLKNQLLFLFLIECSLRNIPTSEDNLSKLIFIFNNAKVSGRIPIFDGIESDIFGLAHSKYVEDNDEQFNTQSSSSFYPFAMSNTLVWRNNFRDISLLISLIWSSLMKTNLFINPISIIISKCEKENCYIWNNVLEQSFDMLLLETIKHEITSFFPIQVNEAEEREWSDHYKILQTIDGDLLKSYPFRALCPMPVPSLSNKLTQLGERTDIIDIFFRTIDTSESNNRLVLDNSINNLRLNPKSIVYHRSFGFIYDNFLNNLNNSNQPTDDWDLNIKIKCISRRILRKLRQSSMKKEILGRIETNFNITTEIANEICEFSTSIIYALEKHSKKETKFLVKLSSTVNGNDKQKYSILQDLIEEVVEFCKQCEISRLSQEKVTDSPDFILFPREQSSYCPDRNTRDEIKNNELFSLLPFLERNLTRSKTNEIVVSTIESHEHFLFQTQTKDQDSSPFANYLEKEIQNISHNSLENSFIEKIIDYSYILSYGKVKLLHPNHYDESFNSVFITEAEASYMNNEQRPLFYRASDSEWELVNKVFPNHVICETIERLEQMASEGVDSRMVFGGFCGGNCELLLLHPDCEELKNCLDMENLKESSAKRRIEYFGEISCGWMNFDDLVGPGIDMSNSSTVNPTRENIWVSNECCTFEYNPKKTLEENIKERKEKQSLKKGLKYVNHPKRFDQLECDHHHLRETIPMYDLKFLFYSAIPFDFKEFCYNK